MTRYQLQKMYGNAGRGLIFPYSLAKTNGPKDFFFSSNISWTSSWIIKPNNQSIGLTGISIKGNSPSGYIKWTTGNDTLNYPISDGKMLFEIQNCQSCSVQANGRIKSYLNQDILIDTLNFSILHDTSSISFEGCTFTLLDLFEQSKKSGVLYHSTGVAGATFKNYNNNPHFESGLKLISPDMVVVSLGTNESVKKWDATAFENDIRIFVERIKTNYPSSKIVLVLPNENYLKINGTYIYNSRIDSVHFVLLKVAKDLNLLTYDQQEAMGGRGCMLQWYKQGLVNEDHIHFLRKGYQKQGLLLFEFLIDNI